MAVALKSNIRTLKPQIMLKNVVETQHTTFFKIVGEC